jgi:O-antigen/teichoic acid export membrane protein
MNQDKKLDKASAWISSQIKTDFSYLAKGGFWLSLGQVIATGSAFLISLIFANLVAPEVFGNYKYVLSIYSLLSIATLSGMDSAVTRAIAKNMDGTLDVGVKEKIKWGFVGALFSILIAGYYFFQKNYSLSFSFLAVSLFVPFYESLDMYNSLLWGKKLFSVQTKFNAFKKVILLLFLTVTLFLSKNLIVIVFVYFFILTVPNFYIFSKVKKTYKENNNVDDGAIKYGHHLSVSYIISTLFTELDKILVFHYVGAVNLAIYSLATAPNDQIKGLFKNVNSLAMPKLSEKNMGQIRNNIWTKIFILGSTAGAIVLTYYFLSPILFKIFFPKYMLSVRYSQILSLSLVPVVMSGFIYTILESQKATKEIYQYNFYGNFFGIAVLFPLVYFYGVWGAVISRLLARTFGFILSAVLLNKISETSETP